MNFSSKADEIASIKDLRRLAQSYADNGFVHFLADPDMDSYRDSDDQAAAARSSLRELASALALGEAFIPPMYRHPATLALYQDGINVIEAREVNGGNAVAHRTFLGQSAQEFHTDGTLQSAGEIPTSVLLCITPAEIGGDTEIFDVREAIRALERDHPEYVSALEDGRALTRGATINGCTDQTTAPVVVRNAGEIRVRFSLEPKDLWAVEGENTVPYLREARQALREMSAAGSRYYRRLSLRAGEGILLANDRVAHGRTGFQCATLSSRRLLRGLYLRRPTLAA